MGKGLGRRSNTTLIPFSAFHFKHEATMNENDWKAAWNSSSHFIFIEKGAAETSSLLQMKRQQVGNKR